MALEGRSPMRVVRLLQRRLDVAGDVAPRRSSVVRFPRAGRDDRRRGARLRSLRIAGGGRSGGLRPWSRSSTGSAGACGNRRGGLGGGTFGPTEGTTGPTGCSTGRPTGLVAPRSEGSSGGGRFGGRDGPLGGDDGSSRAEGGLGGSELIVSWLVAARIAASMVS
jgi:hypothetical protein